MQCLHPAATSKCSSDQSEGMGPQLFSSNGEEKTKKAQGARSPVVHEAWSWVLSLALRDPEPCVSPESLRHGTGWMEPSPDFLWGSNWAGEVPEHIWVWPGHATHGTISHIPFLAFEPWKGRVLMCSPVTVTLVSPMPAAAEPGDTTWAVCIGPALQIDHSGQTPLGASFLPLTLLWEEVMEQHTQTGCPSPLALIPHHGRPVQCPQTPHILLSLSCWGRCRLRILPACSPGRSPTPRDLQSCSLGVSAQREQVWKL